MLDNLLDTENGTESSISQDKVNNSSLYLDETDSNGVPLLRRIEKYPDLPETEFIPIEYIHSNGLKVPEDKYLINKKGEIYSKYTNKLIKKRTNNWNYEAVTISTSKGKVLQLFVHRLMAFTFLENPDTEIYNTVNHIDHNPENNNLFNLEWVTAASNSDKQNGKSLCIGEDKLLRYIALDDNKEEVFRFTSRDKISSNYVLSSVSRSAEKGLKYKEYFWKIENKRERASIPLGFLGNLSDYEWTEHRKYSGYYICREGFIKKGNRLLAGSINKDGYIIVQIQGKPRRIHRVIMEHFLGRDLKDDEVIDHVDCVRHNNNISNLRVTDRKGNMNNPLTVKKISRSLVVADLFGNFISYETIAEIYNRIRSREGHDKSSLLKKLLLDLNIYVLNLKIKVCYIKRWKV